VKYGELINFDPIDTVIQIRDADDSAKAVRLIETYVMSDDMAQMINDRILTQLSLDEVIDNKGVFLVGNYGTGKSHLMSVISAIAQDENKIKHLKNKRFADYVKPIAGRFEVLRIEIGAVRTSLRDIITKELEKDLSKRGVFYSFPAEDAITGNKDALNEMMGKFETVYGAKGYLLVIDELLDYLKSRTQMDLMLDLAFLRELGEFIKNSRFRLICGVQEALFDNPAFSFVASTLLKVKDRYEQAIIRREDIAYVVSERILKKNAEQKAKIREHLQKFCSLYKNMAERLEEFVELYPIHPVYIEIFQRVYLAEKREVLKTISATVKGIIDQEVPVDRPGIKSYDTYWKYIKENLAKKAEPEIKEVLDKSGVLEDIINRSFTSKAIYKPLAIQAIYALSVHRLTTGGLDVRSGLTVQNLKDDVCLYIDTPVKEEEFLTSTVQSVMKAIMDTVSGQFIEYNKDNEQYFLDLKKDIDYDARIEQKASVLHDSQLNDYFYSVIYDMLDWEAVEYVPGFKIYEYFINWEAKNIYREGYLFMGNPTERSTAQPPRDFYVYFLPPFGVQSAFDNRKEDEVFFNFSGDEKFKENLKMYAAAKEMEVLAAQSDTKKTYGKKAEDYKKAVKRWIDGNKISCFTVTYRGVTRQMLEVLHGKRTGDKTFKEVIDMASSLSLSEYFSEKYPKYPKFQVRVTERNIHEVLARGLDYIAGKQIQDGANLLDSFGLLTGGKIKPENSMYAMHFVRKLNSMPGNNVLNAVDIFENPYQDVYYDKEFKLGREWIVLILGALAYSGHVTILAANNVRYDASNLDALARENKSNLYEFKHISRPKAPAMAELKRLFGILGIPEGLIVNPNTWEDAVKEMLAAVKSLTGRALHAITVLNEGFALWGEPLIPGNIMEDYKERIRKALDFGNAVNSRFNSPAKLQNFDYTMEQLGEIEDGIKVTGIVERYEAFKSRCSANVEYFSKLELVFDDESWIDRIRAEKAAFIEARDAIRTSDDGVDYAAVINNRLNSLKEEYITYYTELHARCRLGVNESARKGEILEGHTMANLRKLANISGILSVGKFNEIVEKELSLLKVCYELSPTELKQSHICPHCHLKPSDNDRPVRGRLDMIEDRLDRLAAEWTATLLSSIEDPLVANDVVYLKPEQRKAVEKFMANRQLPGVVDNHFVDAVNTLLQGLDKVEVDVTDLSEIITSWGPCTVEDIKSRFDALVADWSRGRDKSRLRIIIKK
jgi:hypothetical protein